MSMASNSRRILAALSACVIIANFFAYIYSFFGASVERIYPWFIPFILGWVVLFSPIYAREYPASRSPSFALKGFARGMPNWVAPCSWLLLLVAIAHFLWFAVHSGWGVPAILDGQYVLAARGHILKVLTQGEYLRLSGAGARMFAAMMVYFYFVPMVYWWFRRNEQNAT